VFHLLAALLGFPLFQEETLCSILALLEAALSAGVKLVAAKQLLQPVYQLLASPLSLISLRALSSETLNLLLLNCPSNSVLLRKSVSPQQLVKVLQSCTDYMLQSVVFEILYRFTFNLSMEELQEAFSDHGDLHCAELLRTEQQDFAATTRIFLNHFNAELKGAQRIFSLQCQDSGDFVDFGVIELAWWAEGAEDATIIQYKDVSHLKVANSTLMLWEGDASPTSFLFGAESANLLQNRISTQINAVVYNHQQGAKTSVVTIPIPSTTLPDDVSTVARTPLQSAHSPALPTPMTDAFAMPQQKRWKSSTPILQPFPSPSVSAPYASSMPPASPLAQTFLQFGNALERQLAHETNRVRKEGQDFIDQLAKSFQDLAQQQNRETIEWRKRKGAEIEHLRAEVQTTTDDAKKLCTTFLHELNETIASVDQATQALNNVQEEMQQEQETLLAKQERTRMKFLNQLLGGNKEH
jgi:hypothetical protein